MIAYRRQRDVEQGRFVERFGAAAAQLGATDVAVRIAGVYAMAGVANETDSLRRQQCIDVLCGYLRLPYDAEHGSSGRTKLVVTTPRVTDEGQPNGDLAEHIEYRQNDKEVRQTIIRVIADHLRPEAEYRWSTSNFDFRAAHLEDVDLRRATFTGTTHFSGATFTGTTHFSGATFSGDAWFDKATFTGNASFDTASFSGNAWFDMGTFGGGTSFRKATFSGKASFDTATFTGNAWFDMGTFGGGTSFRKATFSGKASFDTATF
ncbi:pentapeptide repeat-containing protein, partial [Nocardia sp. NPDC051900]|uniref:pentapeptide repeat-containing protein n=1 Tax=Nocardia sp. NPDC051900 TaxID=3364326 RepID=UPI0037A40810